LLEAPRRIPKLIIVNGPVVFCNFDDLIEQAIYRTRNLVYVQNDYAIEVLKSTGNPNQKNRLRAAMYHFKGKLSYWTSVEPTLERAPKTSTLVNWNALTWRPVKDNTVKPVDKRVLYYGAFRKARLPSFDTYFKEHGSRFYLSTTKTGAKQFQERYPALDVGNAVQDVIEEFRGRFAAGLLIADRLSNKVYHCPPNRWYEMLSMGLPVLVDAPCRTTLERAGYVVPESDAVRSPQDILDLLGKPRWLRKLYDTQAQWRRKDPRPTLRRELSLAVKRSGL
jgi:hypothetical protein